MVAHGGLIWTQCGTCGQEFCETDCTLPANLTVGKAIDADEDNQNNVNQSNYQPPYYIPIDVRLPSSLSESISVEPNLLTRSSSSDRTTDLIQPYASKLTILTINRIIDNHEAKHCLELRPPKSLPYLPGSL